jgi:hypothetical protein
MVELTNPVAPMMATFISFQFVSAKFLKARSYLNYYEMEIEGIVSEAGKISASACC